MNIKRRKYVLEPRNGHNAIDEYQSIDGKWRNCRFIMSTKTRKQAEQIVNELNWAIDNFINDNDLKFLIGCQ